MSAPPASLMVFEPSASSFPIARVPPAIRMARLKLFATASVKVPLPAFVKEASGAFSPTTELANVTSLPLVSSVTLPGPNRDSRDETSAEEPVAQRRPPPSSRMAPVPKLARAVNSAKPPESVVPPL